MSRIVAFKADDSEQAELEAYCKEYATWRECEKEMGDPSQY